MGPGVIAVNQNRGADPNQPAGNRAEDDPPTIGAAVIVSLGEKPVAGEDAEYAAGGQGGCDGPPAGVTVS